MFSIILASTRTDKSLRKKNQQSHASQGDPQYHFLWMCMNGGEWKTDGWRLHQCSSSSERPDKITNITTAVAQPHRKLSAISNTWARAATRIPQMLLCIYGGDFFLLVLDFVIQCTFWFYRKSLRRSLSSYFNAIQVSSTGVPLRKIDDMLSKEQHPESDTERHDRIQEKETPAPSASPAPSLPVLCRP